MGLRFFIIGETTAFVWGMTCTNTFQLCIKREKKREGSYQLVFSSRHSLKSLAYSYSKYQQL